MRLISIRYFLLIIDFIDYFISSRDLYPFKYIALSRLQYDISWPAFSSVASATRGRKGKLNTLTGNSVSELPLLDAILLLTATTVRRARVISLRRFADWELHGNCRYRTTKTNVVFFFSTVFSSLLKQKESVMISVTKTDNTFGN